MTADEAAVVEYHAEIAAWLCLGGRLQWSKGDDHHAATFTTFEGEPRQIVRKDREGFRLLWPTGVVSCAGRTIGDVLTVDGPRSLLGQSATEPGVTGTQHRSGT